MQEKIVGAGAKKERRKLQASSSWRTPDNDKT